MMDPLTFLVAQMKTNLGWRDQLAASAFVGCEPVAADDGVGYDVADVAVAVVVAAAVVAFAVAASVVDVAYLGSIVP